MILIYAIKKSRIPINVQVSFIIENYTLFKANFSSWCCQNTYVTDWLQ